MLKVVCDVCGKDVTVENYTDQGNVNGGYLKDEEGHGHIKTPRLIEACIECIKTFGPNGVFIGDGKQ